MFIHHPWKFGNFFFENWWRNDCLKLTTFNPVFTTYALCIGKPQWLVSSIKSTNRQKLDPKLWIWVKKAISTDESRHLGFPTLLYFSTPIEVLIYFPRTENRRRCLADVWLNIDWFDWERRSGIDLYIAHFTKDRQIKPNLPKGPFLVVAINSDEEDLVQVDYNLHLRWQRC